MYLYNNLPTRDQHEPIFSGPIRPKTKMISAQAQPVFLHSARPMLISDTYYKIYHENVSLH